MSSTNCPCDAVPTLKLAIHAGLSNLPRQLGTFPEFRALMLRAIGSEPALAASRARSSDDFGIMLLEMWAYVCDCTSLYDEAIANECYVRTAQLRPSLRKLVALLGYLPRPAVGARVDLAILAEGRRPIALPAGTAFRSGAFPGGPPQMFELDTPGRVHPFTNKWTLARTRRLTLDANGPPVSNATPASATLSAAAQFAALFHPSVSAEPASPVTTAFASAVTVSLAPLPDSFYSRRHFLLDPKSVRLKAEQIVLVEDLGEPANTRARTVASIEDSAEADGVTYKKVTLSEPVPIPGNTRLENVRITTPAQVATVWKQNIAFSGTVFGVSIYEIMGPTYLPGSPIPLFYPYGYFLAPSGLFHFSKAFVVFEAVHLQIRRGDKVILEKHGELRWFTVTGTGEITVDTSSDRQATWIGLDASFNDKSRGGNTVWSPSDASSIQVHLDFRTAATPTVPADLTLDPGDPMNLMPPLEAPQDGTAPNRFLLQDRDSTGEEITAAINFPARTLKPTKDLPQPLVAPVTVYGNVVSASRGETVSGEVLGSGDASTVSQTFKLKKSPLTYLPAPDGVVSPLKVYVDGLQWTESRSFFGVGPEEQVYIVRQNDDGDSLVTFGDGLRGRRLPTGSNNVVAYYRYGAGKASPPTGSIHQMSKPVRGVTSVKNPVAAFGGDDAEGASGLRTYAPRSALLLGRAISILDMEAAAASVSGVRAVRAEWRWNKQQQCPVVQVWYIGPEPIGGDVISKLSGLSDSVTPIAAERATPVVGTLSLSIATEAGRIEKDVLANVRGALLNQDSGILAPEHIGIGLPLFRSRIFQQVLTAPGAASVTGLLWNGKQFGRAPRRKLDYAIQPGSGKYFDFENGTVLLNGKAGVDG